MLRIKKHFCSKLKLPLGPDSRATLQRPPKCTGSHRDKERQRRLNLSHSSQTGIISSPSKSLRCKEKKKIFEFFQVPPTAVDCTLPAYCNASPSRGIFWPCSNSSGSSRRSEWHTQFLRRCFSAWELVFLAASDS